jgi:hypothetical protein
VYAGRWNAHAQRAGLEESRDAATHAIDPATPVVVRFAIGKMPSAAANALLTRSNRERRLRRHERVR